MINHERLESSLVSWVQEITLDYVKFQRWSGEKNENYYVISLIWQASDILGIILQRSKDVLHILSKQHKLSGRISK